MRAVVVHGARARRRRMQTARDARIQFGICVREVLDQVTKGLRPRETALGAIERYYARLANDYMRTPGADASLWRSHGPEADLEQVRKETRTEAGWKRLLQGGVDV